MQYFKNTFLFINQNSTVSLLGNWEVCENSTFLRLCLTKGTVDV
jgi:hypothetical protein